MPVSNHPQMPGIQNNQPGVYYPPNNNPVGYNPQTGVYHPPTSAYYPPTNPQYSPNNNGVQYPQNNIQQQQNIQSPQNNGHYNPQTGVYHPPNNPVIYYPPNNNTTIISNKPEPSPTPFKPDTTQDKIYEMKNKNTYFFFVVAK